MLTDGPYTNIDVSIPVSMRDELMADPSLSGSSPTHRITELIWKLVGPRMMEREREIQEQEDYKRACDFVFSYASRVKHEAETRK